ncbi:MAG: hypothetical protein JO362_20200 [Streptomycetaceae bacterium]|nr:hypothetical protein [Streptomycetaceae bacterium]
MNDGMPRDHRGLRPCAWCGQTIRHQPPTGRLREYCKAGCRELAYRERRTQRRIAEAVKAATTQVSPVDETVSANPSTTPTKATLPAQGGTAHHSPVSPVDETEGKRVAEPLPLWTE